MESVMVCRAGCPALHMPSSSFFHCAVEVGYGGILKGLAVVLFRGPEPVPTSKGDMKPIQQKLKLCWEMPFNSKFGPP
jgi:hypothetical protein